MASSKNASGCDAGATGDDNVLPQPARLAVKRSRLDVSMRLCLRNPHGRSNSPAQRYFGTDEDATPSARWPVFAINSAASKPHSSTSNTRIVMRVQQEWLTSSDG